MAKTTGDVTFAYNHSGTWIDTGIAAAQDYYQQWVVELDLATDTVNVSLKNGGYTFTDLSANTTSFKVNIIVTELLIDQPVFRDMSSITSLELVSSPEIGHSKKWQLDDALVTFPAEIVPEPYRLLLLGMGIFCLIGRRKR